MCDCECVKKEGGRKGVDVNGMRGGRDPLCHEITFISDEDFGDIVGGVS